jgi:hypothetical protein
MSYATLNEIWPDFIHSNKFQKYVNTLPQNVVNNLIESADTRGGNKYNKYQKPKKAEYPEPIQYEKSRDYPLEEKQQEKQNIEKFSNLHYGKYHSECSSILLHLSQCEKCRKFVQSKFAPPKKIEDEEEENDEYLDLAIYIVTGIFILFILDMLMKFGKKRR